MELIKAAEQTLKLAELLGGYTPDGAEVMVRHIDTEYIPIGNGDDIQHQVNILNQIIYSEIDGEKAHRCLGWAQAMLTVNGIGNLSTYRVINGLCQ